MGLKQFTCTGCRHSFDIVFQPHVRNRKLTCPRCRGTNIIWQSQRQGCGGCAGKARKVSEAYYQKKHN